MYFYPPYWPLLSLIIFTIVLWISGDTRPFKRRLIRTVSFLVVFTPGAAAVHSLIVFPLSLVPIAWFASKHDIYIVIAAAIVFVPAVALTMVGFVIQAHLAGRRKTD